MIADGGFVLFEAPTDAGYFLSIADLAHANLSQPFINPNKYYNNPLKTYSAQNSWPAYAIGNSLQDPRIPANLTARYEWPNSNPDPNGYYHYDVSYLLNDALWDAYFFSAYDTAENESANPRHALSNFNFGFDTSAAGIYIEGAFNVNSTSVRAWKAFLASALAAAVESRSGEFSDSDTTPFLRVAQPNGEPASDLRNTHEDAVYNGFLTLSSTDIDRLAQAIVEQVKKRGPFISMSHFVNRVLDDADYRSERESDYQSSDADGARAMMVGALQAAIDLSEINLRNGAGEDRFNDAEVQLIQTDLEAFYRELDIAASIGDRAAGTPGYLTQLDLLDAIGPYISTRSDTFVIHAYGESINPLTDEVQATARCKATVQRLPEFVEDRANSATDNYADLSTQNQTFGRKFRIIDFQWID
ncbi:hypothetical protein [Cerasicoccus fimbriatus]|uniref:hypothetical protein n=1 Tax=Cerasicoccus fimbriatus TaxID=3014554 RepID=UPI0022B5A7ED|nr:hypothetical protein [Cerasicoccus sp. TK19100]